MERKTHKKTGAEDFHGFVHMLKEVEVLELDEKEE